jgi:hypothetical protein
MSAQVGTAMTPTRTVFQIALAFGMGIVILAYSIGNKSGGHVNCAVRSVSSISSIMYSGGHLNHSQDVLGGHMSHTSLISCLSLIPIRRVRCLLIDCVLAGDHCPDGGWQVSYC